MFLPEAKEARAEWRRHAKNKNGFYVSDRILPPPAGWHVQTRFISVLSKEQGIFDPENGGYRELEKGSPERGWLVKTYRLEGNAPFPRELNNSGVAPYHNPREFFIRMTSFLEFGSPRVSCDRRYDLCLPEPHRWEFPMEVKQCTWIFQRYFNRVKAIKFLREQGWVLPPEVTGAVQ